MKISTLSIAFSLLASSVSAEVVDALVMKVEPNYNYYNEPVQVEDCYLVDVPVYGRTNGGSAGDVVTGAIIGGVIGNQFGNGNGKDAMTVLGAIAGANVADQPRRVIVGSRTEQHCDYRTEYVESREVDGYVVYYKYGYRQGTVVTERQYYPGDIIKIKFK